MKKQVHFQVEDDPKKLLPFLPAIQRLQDSERDALGFLPSSAFEDALRRRKLIAAFDQAGDVPILAGYLLYSGVFPHAKIQQISSQPQYRNAGCATALMRSLVSELERLGFLTLRADVASDLAGPLKFYARNGFEPVREKAGGVSRGRKIILHSRQLETENLLTPLAAPQTAGLNLRSRSKVSTIVPVFALDLNVYFDLAKRRQNSEEARRLFGEALGHTLRLTVANEFVEELRKTSRGSEDDPLLQLALHLPRLMEIDNSELQKLSGEIHDLIFVRTLHKDANSKQALSDSRHVAHAALSRVTAFVTRDGAILGARRELLLNVGIDVVTTDEVLDLLPSINPAIEARRLSGFDFEIEQADEDAVQVYGNTKKIDPKALADFLRVDQSNVILRRLVVKSGGTSLGLGCLSVPKAFDPVAKLLIHVDHAHPDAELFADYLLDNFIRYSCNSAAAFIQLCHLPGQSQVSRLAKTRGFNRDVASATFLKIAFGRPISKENWGWATQLLRRKTGIALPDDFKATGGKNGIEVRRASGDSIWSEISQLETLIGPTVILSPKRNGVIVPIVRSYADQLLGTSNQPMFDFVSQKNASFLSRRGYVNSIRAAKLMRPGTPILFYESKNAGKGRGAIVAIARIVNSFVVEKSRVDEQMGKTLVVDDLDTVTTTDDVLLSTFDNLMPFPRPVSFKRLKSLDAVGKANFVSAQAISNDKLSKIVADGWN